MQIEAIEPTQMRFFYEPPGTPRLTVGDNRSYRVVKVYQAWPLSEPGRHISFLDEKGEEITLLEDLSGLSVESREVVEEELRRRYLTARVEAVLDIRTEFGVTYWRVRTNRGERDFVVQSLTESCVWLGEGHVLIIDPDGSRFELANLREMDDESRRLLELVF